MTSTINASLSAGIVTTADTSGVLALQTAGTTAVTIDASQNVTLAGTLTTTGITNSGVATATRFNPTGSSVTGNGMYLPAANSVGISTNGTNAVYINSAQNVGIGTASPSGKLEVLGTTGAYAYFSGTSQSIILGDVSGVPYIQAINKAGSNSGLAFYNYSSEAMRIDSSGNLLVGTTTAGGKLSVAGNISVQGGDSSIYRVGGNTWTFVSSNGGYNTNGYHLKLDASTTAGQCSFFTVATETIRFDGSGNASKSSGAGSWLALSDKRIKENIVPVENGLQRICSLKPSTFDYKQPNAHQGKLSDKGFIADDFVEVYPNSIVETDFIAEDDKQYFEEGSLAKSMGFNAEFYADLVAAIQEQQALITQLQADVAALKGA